MLVCCGKEDQARLVAENEVASDAPATRASGKSDMQRTPSRYQDGTLKRYDVVLVLPHYELTEEEKKKDEASVKKQKDKIESFKMFQREVKSRLKAANLHTHMFREATGSDKKGSQFVLVGADTELLKDAAEAIGLEKKLKPVGAQSEHYEAYASYKQEHHDKFRDDEYGGGFFTSLERIKCLFHIIEGPNYAEPGCAELDLDKLVADGVLSNYFCMVDTQRLNALKPIWIYGNPLHAAPIAQIHDYLGEKIALYFAWMQTYTSYLGVLGVVSLVPFITQLAVKGDRTFDNWAVPIYGLVTVVWAQAFLEHWKRQQAKLAFTWNVEQFEDEESLRPEFRQEVQRRHEQWLEKHDVDEELALVTQVLDPRMAEFRVGRWSKAGFVQVDEDDELYEQLEPVEYFDENWQQLRLVISASIAGVLVFVIVIGTIGLMALKVKLATHGGWWEENAALVSAFFNSAFITLMSLLWSKVGIMLNDWEMHRTDTEWEDSLISKTFAFQFINSYVASLYIAFVQGSAIVLPIFRGANGERLRDHCVADDCFRALYYQMAMLVVTKQVTRHLLVLVPIIWAFISKRLFPPKEESSKLHAMVVEQSRLQRFTGTHNEYLEMIIQFGYVAMFAVAFPIGSLLVYINNGLEKRSDAAKVALFSQRPKYLGAQDIGSVQTMLEVVALSSVFTNCIILYLSSQAFRDYFPRSWQEQHPRFALLVVTLIFEHGILFAKQIVNWAVPDTPVWVEIERARNKMRQASLLQLTKEQLERQAQQRSRFANLFRSTGDDDSSDDSEEEYA